MKFSVLALTAGLCLAGLPIAYPTYEGCADLEHTDFEVVDLVTHDNYPDMMEPIKFDFDVVTGSNGQQYVNIYILERRGKISFFNAETGNISTVGEFDVTWGDKDSETCSGCSNRDYGIFEGNDDKPWRDLGMAGFVLDPDFKNNHWIYVMFTPASLEFDMKIVLSRFTLVNNVIDPSSEKLILEHQYLRTCCHIGGGMKFDDYGDLWFGIGNNTTNKPFFDENESSGSDEWGSGSTANLRGGINRIRPLPFADSENPAPGAGTTYSIPRGNLGEFMADKLETDGYWGSSLNAAQTTSLAAEYRDPQKVRPEIYAMGIRNPFNITLDPVRRWVTFGDCGPDVQFEGDAEEHHLVTEPGNLGWPYFAGRDAGGNNLVVNRDFQLDAHGTVADPDEPMNTSKWNQGVTYLPPVVPPTRSYGKSCAMTGPFLRYDPDIDNDIKWPPHFHRNWMVTDFNNGQFTNISVSENGMQSQGEERILNSISNNKPLDVQQGPDGAVYVMFYGQTWYGTTPGSTALSRIEYTGDCLPDASAFTGTVERAGCMDPTDPNYDASATHNSPGACQATPILFHSEPDINGITVFNTALTINLTGAHEVSIHNIRGIRVKTWRGTGVKQYSLADIGKKGLHIVKVKVSGQVFMERVMLY